MQNNAYKNSILYPGDTFAYAIETTSLERTENLRKQDSRWPFHGKTHRGVSQRTRCAVAPFALEPDSGKSGCEVTNKKLPGRNVIGWDHELAVKSS
jgi:hypothetical protein